MSYVYKRRFLDTQYGIRKNRDSFKIGNSVVGVDTDGDNTIKEEFCGSEGLWELLTRKNVNKQHVTSDDLRTCKKILLMTNAHLEGFTPEASLMSPERKSSAKSSPHFSQSPKAGASNRRYAAR